MIVISGKALGKKKPLFADWSIPFPANLTEGSTLPLRDLISTVVRTEVQNFKKSQQERVLFRALSASYFCDFQDLRLNDDCISTADMGQEEPTKGSSTSTSCSSFTLRICRTTKRFSPRMG